ncbi:HEPN domain-containing protein [Pontibacter sp. Tf4]|uniref:HEPN domain-containing protein n=1 Tax=Pontibacter sp. Tf4 TaxID=2761620 RepID=UPI00162A9092|nr:HEPN domain-containing protein [Pontibacter sp. Tf4]MBB6611793.1 HEPN domain-containing protein [Pontibacter sp. Tf4]
MKTSLDHLPEDKKNQVLELKNLILKKVPNADKIILFGSYASGNWVEDKYTENGIQYEYISDFDVLIVTTSREEKEYVSQDKIVNSWHYHTPVNPIVHTIDYVNEGLENGQYFFTDIIKDGILLYDAGAFGFSDPKVLTCEESKQTATEKFNKWYKSASRLLKYAKLGFKESLEEKESLNEVAFLLHQAAERFYNTTLLVFTNYKPKVHNLDKLRDLVKPYSKELYFIFSPLPQNEHEVYLFDLLKKGYIDARYKSEYTIAASEIYDLIDRIEQMQKIVYELCSQKVLSIGIE